MKIKSNNYHIFLGEEYYNNLIEILKNYTKIIIIVDENTKKYCLNYLLNKINISDFLLIEIKSGEKNKDLSNLKKIIQKLINNNIDKNSIILNLGGGLLCDIGGFVASIYKRGIDFINIPTTLLSMVDASIGSKTGINFNDLKNILGSFYSPKMILIDIIFLKTLEKKEILSGYAEMIKHRCIKGDNILNFIENIEINLNTITESITIKNNIILTDLFEKKERKILNFGHTIGHAIETFFIKNNINITHGNSIAIGMICEYFLAYKHNILNIDFVNNFKKNIISKYYKYKIEKENFDEIIFLMYNDKKNKNKNILFSLLNDKGTFFIDETFKDNEIKESLKFYCE